ncbi:MAG TPA: EF-Tu/IF-2/RF-3 family GTPase [Candidatus Thermoplasmatota archaeon]|nr:EF-Tu/IF-2/RF-3 family GTPase [Candidatus Thermoplasmatota archaeon]
MPGVTVALLGNLAYAQELGKKSTESDVALYAYKEGDTFVTTVVPIRYPEKPQPLAYALAAADVGLLVVSALDKVLGETVVAADASGLARGLIVMQNYLAPEQLKPLLKGTSLENWTVVEDNPIKVRQALAELAPAPREGPTRIPIDHHFDVKGIGTVILGFVRQGEVAKHADLRVYPTKKTAQVRSIQVHDVDVATATFGDHVGLALKNLQNADLDRGFTLAPEGSMNVLEAAHTSDLEVRVSKWFKAGVNPGAVLYLASNWQFVPVKVETGFVTPGNQGRITIRPQKPFAIEKGERVALWNLDDKNLRVVGSAVSLG